MERFEETLASLAPRVASWRPLKGAYNPRHGLAIYLLPPPGPSLIQPGTILGEALAGHSGLGCTLLEGIPKKIPGGAVVIGLYDELNTIRPDLLAEIEPPNAPGEYAIITGRNAVITARSREGLVSGMQTLAMILLRHQEPKIPGAAIVDHPGRKRRGIAVELQQNDIKPDLLIQIVSFIATFKANCVEWVLPRDFDPGASPNLDVANQACRSFGIEVSVALPWLNPILSGEKKLLDAWAGLRATAAVFNADRISFDDPCPDHADPDLAWRIIEMMTGSGDLPALTVDSKLLKAAGISLGALNAPGLSGWVRVWEPSDLPGREFRGLPLIMDVPSHLTGLSSRSMDDYHRCLDAAAAWCGENGSGSIMASFRGVGFPHAWQNFLPGAATGLILGWGKPELAEEAVANFATLLYGETGATIVEIWRSLGMMFPRGLTLEQERRLGAVAFGSYPESDADQEMLVSIDWQNSVAHLNNVAKMLESANNNLTRNKATLAGPYFALQLLAWLCRLSFLLPAVERGGGDLEIVRMAEDLMKSFMDWRNYLIAFQSESGLESIDIDKIDAMGNRLGYLCGESG